MKLKSLGYKSEMIFTDFDGHVDDRGDYIVIRTLTNPNYFWGNLLVFNRAPTRSDFSKWIALFKKEFPDERIYHVTLAWDPAVGGDDIGDTSAFLEAGYELELKAVLSATTVHKPPRFNEALEVRPLKSKEEWNESVLLQTRSAHDNLSTVEWEKFYRSQSSRYQAMVSAGFGEWYGGFLSGKLVCSLGIFHRENIGRFQIVSTDPEFRRQGLCGTLVYQAARHTLAHTKNKTLVMCADPDYHAIGIYESVGFQREAIEYGVYWWDRKRHQ